MKIFKSRDDEPEEMTLEFIAVILVEIIERVDKIMATQAEVTAKLQAVLAQQNKTAAEIQDVQAGVDKLNAKVAELQAIIDAGNTGGQVSPELQAAVDAVVQEAQNVDNLIPDMPATTQARVQPASSGGDGSLAGGASSDTQTS